jgi:DNA-binding transcriptional ArsR family regulator
MANALSPATQAKATTVEFVQSVPLDLMNAMYFTAVGEEMEGLDAWPLEARRRMAPDLRAELDFLFTYPEHQAGLLGALNDAIFLHAPDLAGVEGLLAFVRDMPARAADAPGGASIDGLVVYAMHGCYVEPYALPAGTPARDEVRLGLAMPARLPADDSHPPAFRITPEEALALFDRPEELRARMLSVVRRFYDEHYRPDEARRVAAMRASVARHRDELRRLPDDMEAFIDRLSGAHRACARKEISAYRRFVFVPSTYVGPYVSTIDQPPLLAMYYRCEPPEAGGPAGTGDDAQLALVYKALADEQRLRILRLLGAGELYAQEIVERTGIHQSVISRHLSFMKAVGLLDVRRQNNMKFYSLNRAMRAELRGTLDALLPGARQSAGRR